MAKNVISLQKIVGKGYASFWRTHKRYRCVKGSRGSKKSKTCALYYITKLMQHPDSNLLVVRRTYTTLRDSCYSDLKWAIHRLGVSPYWKCKENPLEITYLPTGQKILFRGMDDGLKITSISVPKGVLCWVWCEEFYEVTNEDDFNKLDMSIRGEMPEGLWKQITITFNPWSEKSWLKARFFDPVDDPDIFTATTTYKCNEWLDEADLRIFERMKRENPKRYRIEGLGEWGIAEGLIFEDVEVQDFDPDEIRAKQNIKACFGLDFGYTDPNAFVASMVDKDNKIIYVFDEFYKRGITNARIAQIIGEMGYGSEKIVCDSAEPKSIAELYDLGIKAEPSRKGRDSVLHGIQLMQNYKFIVHPKCTEFYREISNYAWEKDKFGKPTDKPDHEFSHGIDAVRYSIAKHLIGDTFSWE